MKPFISLFYLFNLFPGLLNAQTNSLQDFPKGTQLEENIPYSEDTLVRHRLDIYLPPGHSMLHPVIFWIHSGGWRAGDKKGDMHNMPKTLHNLIQNGYAIIAINYRYSTAAIFPAQIIDCNNAMKFIYENATKYKLDTTRIALMGFSAGGHLAALMGLSSNNQEPFLSCDGKPSHFRISAVVDFYGLSDFYLIPKSEYIKSTNGPGLLFGGPMNEKPELVKKANPITYLDAHDPPFLIIHGKKDDLMDVRQSIALHDSLIAHHVESSLILVEGAPHGGGMFDSKKIRISLISFLSKHLR